MLCEMKKNSQKFRLEMKSAPKQSHTGRPRFFTIRRTEPRKVLQEVSQSTVHHLQS